MCGKGGPGARLDTRQSIMARPIDRAVGCALNHRARGMSATPCDSRLLVVQSPRVCMTRCVKIWERFSLSNLVNGVVVLWRLPRGSCALAGSSAELARESYEDFVTNSSPLHDMNNIGIGQWKDHEHNKHLNIIRSIDVFNIFLLLINIAHRHHRSAIYASRNYRTYARSATGQLHSRLVGGGQTAALVFTALGCAIMTVHILKSTTLGHHERYSEKWKPPYSSQTRRSLR